MVAFLTSCASSSKLSKVEVPTPVYPPDSLLQDCAIPKKTILTNEDLALWSKELLDGLKVCNVDKQSLRKWKDEWKSKENK